MRLPLLPILILLLLPAAQATWYYAGDTFTEDGVVYSVEGSDHELVLLGAGGHTYLLRLGECVRNGLMEYCYTQTAYPSDDDHIKFEAGDVFYGYELSIEEVEPDLDVSRDLSEEDPLLNEEITMTVTIENTGEYRVTGIVYDEMLPAGIVATSGSTGNRVSHTKTAIAPGDQYTFKYKVKPVAYGTYELKPTISYVSENVRFNASVGKETVTVASPVDIDRYVTDELGLDQIGAYSLNITNELGGEVDVDVSISIPDGIAVTTPVGLKREGNTYAASGTLDEGDDLVLSFKFTAGGPGDYRFPLSITTVKDSVSSTAAYNDTVESTADGIVPSIGVSPGKTTHPGGAQATITAVLKNENDESGFRKVQGALSGAGILESITKDYGVLGEGETITLITSRVTLPNVTNQTSYVLRFAGSYESLTGKRFEFSTEKSLTVAPLIPAVTVTHALSPKTAVRGENITVTVSAKNIYGRYIVIDTHEVLPEGIETLGGLTYAEASIEKDATQQLYIYQVSIPADYAPDTLELLTVSRVQGESEPQESAASIAVTGDRVGGVPDADETAAPNPATIDSDGDGIPDVEEAQVEQDTPGVFTRAWNWLKGLFS